MSPRPYFHSFVPLIKAEIGFTLICVWFSPKIMIFWSIKTCRLIFYWPSPKNFSRLALHKVMLTAPPPEFSKYPGPQTGPPYFTLYKTWSTLHFSLRCFVCKKLFPQTVASLEACLQFWNKLCSHWIQGCKIYIKIPKSLTSIIVIYLVLVDPLCVVLHWHH